MPDRITHGASLLLVLVTVDELSLRGQVYGQSLEAGSLPPIPSRQGHQSVSGYASIASEICQGGGRWVWQSARTTELPIRP